MIISASTDYRKAAKRRLPPFLFHYLDGGAYSEHTLRRNTADLADIALRQRVLKNMSQLSLETTLFDEQLAMPLILAPVGLTGMYARRGEVQAARAAAAKGIPLRSPPCRFVLWKRWLRRLLARYGFSCMCSKIVVLCEMCWNVRRRQG